MIIIEKNWCIANLAGIKTIKMKEIDLAIIGNLAFSNEVTPVTKRVCLGGGAYYAAVGSSAVSERIGLVSRIGPDFPVEPLIKRKIDIEGVKIVPEGETPVFTVYQNPDNARIFANPKMGLASEADPTIFPASYLLAKYIYLATSLPDQHLLWIKNLKSRGIDKSRITANAFELYVREYPELTKTVLSNVGTVFLNEEELNTLKQYGELMFSTPVVLTKGPLGAIYIDGNEIISVPAPKVNVVDTTGAGDTLAGVFLALRSQNIPIEQALERAVNIASTSITEFGVEHINPY